MRTWKSFYIISYLTKYKYAFQLRDLEVYLFRHLGHISTSICVYRYNYDIQKYVVIICFLAANFQSQITQLTFNDFLSQNVKDTNAFHWYFGTLFFIFPPPPPQKCTLVFLKDLHKNVTEEGSWKYNLPFIFFTNLVNMSPQLS